jgi:hypothetical protein
MVSSVDGQNPTVGNYMKHFLMGLYCDACHLTTGAGVLPSTVFLLFVVSFQ